MKFPRFSIYCWLHGHTYMLTFKDRTLAVVCSRCFKRSTGVQNIGGPRS